MRRTKCCSSDKPWITHKLKSLITKRQKALVAYGKDSGHYKQLRNEVQRACTECKQKFYDSKVASLKESNISRWWRELKGLTGQRARTDWITQLLDEDTPSPAALAKKFNSFLAALTSHFTPLDTSLADLDHNLDAPREFLVDVSSCYNNNNNNNNIYIYFFNKIFITKPQLKSYLQSTCCYKKSNQFIKTLSTIPSLENKKNPIYNK